VPWLAIMFQNTFPLEICPLFYYVEFTQHNKKLISSKDSPSYLYNQLIDYIKNLTHFQRKYAPFFIMLSLLNIIKN